MPDLDDRIGSGLEELVPVVEPEDVFDRVVARRRRYVVRRRVERGALILTMLMVAGVATYGLLRAFSGVEPARPASTARNGDIVFAGDERGAFGQSIYTAGPDGSHVRQLTTGKFLDRDPSWSPDGTRLVFSRETIMPSSDRAGDLLAELYVVNADGTGLHRLTLDDTVQAHPQWSPDGTQILYEASDEFGRYHLWVMNTDGSAARQLTFGLPSSSLSPVRFPPVPLGWPSYTEEGDYVAPRPGEETPTWSPGGDRIAFTRTGQDGAGVYVMNADGSGMHRLTTGAAPAWSPAGDQILFLRGREDTLPGSDLPETSLYVINADGSGLRRITEDHAWYLGAAWSPDGTKVIVGRLAGGLHDLRGGFVVMNADGSGAREVALGQVSAALSSSPSWQPIRSEPIPDQTDRATVPDLLDRIGPTCELSGVDGDFDGDGTSDHAFVYLSEADTVCSAATGDVPHRVLVGWGSGEVTEHPLPDLRYELCTLTRPGSTECSGDLDFLQIVPTGSSPAPRRAEEIAAFAAVDIDGDGRPELAVERPDAGEPRVVEFLRLSPDDPPEAVMAGRSPLALSWGATTTAAARIDCDRDGEGRPEVISTTSQLIGDGTTWTVTRMTYRFDGSQEPGLILPGFVDRVAAGSSEERSARPGVDICGALVRRTALLGTAS